MNFVNVNFQTTLWFRFKLTLVTLKLLQRAAARRFSNILFFFFLFAEVDVEEEGAVGLIDCSTALQSIKCKLKCTWFSFVWENPKILTFLCKPKPKYLKRNSLTNWRWGISKIKQFKSQPRFCDGSHFAGKGGKRSFWKQVVPLPISKLNSLKAVWTFL